MTTNKRNKTTKKGASKKNASKNNTPEKENKKATTATKEASKETTQETTKEISVKNSTAEETSSTTSTPETTIANTEVENTEVESKETGNTSKHASNSIVNMSNSSTSSTSSTKSNKDTENEDKKEDKKEIENEVKQAAKQDIEKENTESATTDIGATAKATTDTEKKSDNNNTTLDASITNQLGDTKENMATSNTNPENTEAKKANKTTESITIPAPVQKSGSGLTTFVAGLAFVLSVSAGGGGYWMWNQMNMEKQESAAAIAALQQQLESQKQAITDSQTAMRSELAQTQATIKATANETQQAISMELTAKSMAIESMAKLIETSTATKIEAAESNLSSAQLALGKANLSIIETQKRQASLETSLEAVYARIGNTSREWVIAEADFLLQIANHRLQLEQDVTTAMQALVLADNRINSLSDPALNEVRNVIAQELMALQTLPQPDHAALSNQLAALQNQVDNLPLASRTMPIKPTNIDDFDAKDAMQVESWQVLPVAILDVLKGMVSVTYNDKPMAPLLSPTQVRNLHENLKLKLEQARIVSLRGDTELYTSNLNLAIEWTSKHFNNDEVVTKKFIEALEFLKTKQIVLKTPDISRSLSILRSVAKRLDMNLPSMSSNEITNKNALASN